MPYSAVHLAAGGGRAVRASRVGQLQTRLVGASLEQQAVVVEAHGRAFQPRARVRQKLDIGTCHVCSQIAQRECLGDDLAGQVRLLLLVQCFERRGLQLFLDPFWQVVIALALGRVAQHVAA